MALGAVGMLLGIAVLIVLCVKGFNAFLSSMIASIVVIIFNGLPFWDSIITTYFNGMSGFIGTYTLFFCLAAAYGELMKVTGAAETIANYLFKLVGVKYTAFATLLVTWILAYGGINAFIVVFAVYPIAMPMFRQANISKNIMPAIFLYGSVVCCVCTPGANSGLLIALSSALGVDLLAGTAMGTITLIVALAFGFFYLTFRARALAAKGEVFEMSESDHKLELSHAEKGLPPLWSSLLPVVVMIIVRNGLVAMKWASLPASYTALLTAIVLLLVLQRNFLIGIATETFTKGFFSAVDILLLNAGTMGFAAVINACAAFSLFTDFAMWMCDSLNPYISSIVSVSIFSGITGASLSGSTIFGNLMAETYLSYGIEPAALYRIVSVASMGLDTLPHCPTFLAMAAVCGVTAKKSYSHVFWCTVVAPIALAFMCVALALVGIV